MENVRNQLAQLKANVAQIKVEEANLETLELSGAIEWSTPVWRQGMSEWKPFGEMFNRASVRCHECQHNVDLESTVRYRDLFICP